jgi:DNA-binding SARP family transcriptional activator/tetratricopeptide (TPR) repeat protein
LTYVDVAARHGEVSRQMRYLVLGSLRVVGPGGEIRLPDRLRVILALLLCREGEPTLADALIDAVWGGRPPPSARKNLQVYVHQLRRALGPDVSLPRRDGGYALQVADGEVDARQFEDLAAQGRKALAAGDDDRGRQLLRGALALWRGPAYSGITEVPAVRAAAARLDESRLAALEARVDADLAGGAAASVVPELTALVAEHPWRENLVGQLMRALYRTGRQTDALHVFRTARRTLAEELGVEPGARLRSLERAILANTPDLDVPAAPEREPARPVSTDRPIPAQLPADLPVFTGRTEQLRRLDALLPPASTGAGPIAAIVGLAGAGKTTLAVHWAHWVSTWFPDGQLYVNLRGFAPSTPPMAPDEAVRGFLEALQGPTGWIPSELTAQTALYRSLLADKRVLVVLDNARDTEQVRPLLPAAVGCAAVVTSRNQLSGLVAIEAAQPVPLGVLSVRESGQLLADRLGGERVAAEQDAVAEIVRLCARLPLALAIAAARAAVHPDFPLTALARDLRDRPGGLDALAGDSASTDVRAVLSWSYRSLPDAAARLFRLLGMHPGPDVSVSAAASLAGVPVAEARGLLADLTNAQLLTEHAPGRFTFHDLLRRYAQELAATAEPDSRRADALRRVLDHYVHTAHDAAVLLDPSRGTLPLAPLAREVTPEPIDDLDAALDWFTIERPVLLSALSPAAAAGLDRQVCQLAWSLKAFLHRGYLVDAITAEQARLDAAIRLGDRPEQVLAYCNLTRARTMRYDFDDAHRDARLGLDLAEELGDPIGQAHLHHELTWVLGRAGQWSQALPHAERALDLYRHSDDPALTARALNGVGYCLMALRLDLQRALTLFGRGLAIFQELGYTHSQAYAWDGLGYTNRGIGRHDEAIRCHQRALAIFRDTGDIFAATESLDRLGDAYHAAGDIDAAHAAWDEALAVFDQQRHPAAADIRQKLSR